MPKSVDEPTLSSRFGLIADLAARLGGGGQFEDHIKFLTEQVCKVLKTDACVIRELRGNDLVLLGTHGVPKHHIIRSLPADQGIAEALVKRREPVTIVNAPKNPLTARIYARNQTQPGHFQFVSFVGAPMLAHGQVVGVMGAYMIKERRVFGEQEIDLLQIVSNAAGIALENDRLLSRFSAASTYIRMRILSMLDEEEAKETEEERSPDDTQPLRSTRARDLISLEYDLRRAQHQIELHYQPILEPRSGQLRGYEALIRWNHPQHGQLHPSQFVPLAEQKGLIGTLGIRVAQLAAGAVQRIGESRRGKSPFVSINVSVLQLSDRVFYENLLEIIEGASILPSSIVLEITESSIIEKGSVARNVIADLVDSGFPVFIDDFGAGYSSLSHLIDMPVKGIKLDRCFMPESQKDQRRRAMMGTIVKMAHELGIMVVAEGVENTDQHRIAADMSVDLIQGFGVGTPGPLFTGTAG